MKARRLAFAVVAILLLGTAVGSLLLLRRRARPGRSASYGPYVSGNAFRRTLELYHREFGEYPPDTGPVSLDPWLTRERGGGDTDDAPQDIEPLDLEERM